MKRNTKKGFTLVELVIVIAVIAILAAVLIPTFGGIIEKAEKSAALQEARNEYAAYLMEHAGETTVLGDDEVIYVYANDYMVEIENGAAKAVADDAVKGTDGYNKLNVVKTACSKNHDHQTEADQCDTAYYEFYSK